MATSSGSVVCDNSSLANFKAWAQVISNFMATAGWVQSSDTGQVNWSTIAAVPASTYVYEIWKPGDALTTFFLKIEYGFSGTIVQIKLSLGTSTNGAGTLSGFVVGPFFPQGGSQGSGPGNQGATAFNYYLSGDTGRICIAMWVNSATGSVPTVFVVARSKNSSGANTSSHVTLMTFSTAGRVSYQSVVFGTGLATLVNFVAGIAPVIQTGQASNLFASTDVPISPFFPAVGFYDNPLIEMGAGAHNDITDQATFTIAAANMPYGTSHTFIGFSGQTAFQDWSDGGIRGQSAFVMQYE